MSPSLAHISSPEPLQDCITLDTWFKLVQNRIIQGTQVKAAISIRTSYGLAHTGLDVSVTITQTATGEKVSRKLTWNADSQVYASDEVFDSSDKLGEVFPSNTPSAWRVADLLALRISFSL